MNYKLLYSSLAIFSLLFSGSINGYVSNHEGEPLYGVNIVLIDTEIGNMTDEEGYFNIQQLNPGKYKLKFNYIGYQEKIYEFYISENEIKDDENSEFIEKLDLELDDNSNNIKKGKNIDGVLITLIPQLLDYDAIVVSASKTKEKVYEAPATISVVSQRKIREFSGTDIGSALSKVKGMDVYQAGNGRTNINTRGFMAVFNGRFVTLMDGKKFSDPIFRTAFNNTFPTIMEDIERLEVVFGPSSALYGPNAHNGLINIITKHPKEYPGIDFTLTSGLSSSLSNHQSQRLRYAKAGDRFSYKVNIENSTFTEWDFNRVYAPADFNNDGQYDTFGENFEDLNGNSIIDSESYYDANHDGKYSPWYSVERDCFLYGCEIDGATGIPTNILTDNGISYSSEDVILIAQGDSVGQNGVWDDTVYDDVYNYYIVSEAEDFTDANQNGTWDEGEPWVDRGNGEFDYLEPFTDCGYNLLGDYLCEGDEGWNSDLGDGFHNGPEGLELFQSDFENKLFTRKYLGSFYYQLNDDTELSFEPTIIQQKNYVPYDMGYLFIDNTYSSYSTKINNNNFNASLNYDKVDGVVITSEELYNAALKLFNGDLSKARKFFNNDEFNKNYDVSSFYGTLSGTYNLSSPLLKSFIYGLDFRSDSPRTNRNILRDRGSNQKYIFDGDPLNTETVGENIDILQYGFYSQLSMKPINDLDLIFATRIDYHSHFDQYYLSPRLALKWSGLKSSNIRLTYNRAHQVPSLFHLFGHIYNQNTLNFDEDLYGNVSSFQNPENLDVYGNPIETFTIVSQPYIPLFAGNGDGFTIDDTVKIDPLEVEIVDSYEFGIKGMPMKNLFIDFNAYYSKFHNMTSTTQYMQTIYPHGFVPFTVNQLTHMGDQEMDKRDILFTYVNLGEIEYLGMDISFEYQLNYSTSIFSTYSYYNTVKLTTEQNETPYVGNDWAWAELVKDNIDVSPYDIMHFNAPNEKLSFGFSVNDFLISDLYFEMSAKFNSKFDFESGGWNYSEDDQNESYLYTGCG